MIRHCHIIYNTCIFFLLRKWGIIPVFIFGCWKSCICTCQTKQSIIMIVKEAGLSWWLASVACQMQVDSTNGTLEVSHLPTDLWSISVFISCFLWLEMHVWMCEIPTQTAIGTWWYLVSLFLKIWTIEPPLLKVLLFWPFQNTCYSFLRIFLMCSSSNVGITWIFVMGWVVIDHMIGK